MKIAIVGSRGFDNYEYMQKILSWFNCKQIVSGGARGADLLAKRYAVEQGLPLIEFLPNWNLYGKSAGYKRNILIVEHCDELIAFWDKSSKGTAHSIELAKKAGKPVHVFWPDGDDLIESVGV